MDRSLIRRLKTQTLKEHPLNQHALAWSCDAELAVAAADAIYIYFPEYPSVPEASGSGDGEAVLQHQFASYLRVEGVFRPDPAINQQMCELAGIRLPSDPSIGDFWRQAKRPVPGREITGKGAALCQIASLEWSPTGLGANLRPVLTAMLTTGQLLTIGDALEGDLATAPATRSRNTKMWKILWGLGVGLPIPAEDEEGAYRTMDERIKSFSWAKEILPGRALLAYATDEDEIVIMAIQHFLRPKPKSMAVEDVWEVAEVARFDARSPHKPLDLLDPDYIPTGSASSLSWSPWKLTGDSRTATVSYIGSNYVGFRRVTLAGLWAENSTPEVHIADSDSNSLCLCLSTDAFVKWEDAVWTEEGQNLARGIICTPFEAKPFQVNLTGDARPPVEMHALQACGTDWFTNQSTNPIIDLVLHPPVLGNKPKMPIYSLVRRSATSANKDWYETNAIPQREKHHPQWAEYVKRTASRLIPLDAAPETAQSDSDSSESEEEEEEEEDMEEDEASQPKFHPYRFHFWGLALSPGGGSSAALISRYSTQYPDRRPTSKLFFGWRRGPAQSHHVSSVSTGSKLTTEGRIWEWMYGGGPDVVGSRTDTAMDPSLSHRSDHGEFFETIKANQKCPFCEDKLKYDGYEAKCYNGHDFAICSYSGIAILAPGVSRVCAVCQRGCLKYSELDRLAKEHIGGEVSVPSAGQACGGCGGKFVA